MQNASNVFDILKATIIQPKDKIEEELLKTKAIILYVSFITDPPAVLNTEAIEIHESSEIDDNLNQTYENLVSAIENLEYRGSG